MTLDELDALIETRPGVAAALLTEFDWAATMQDPRAAEHQVAREPGGIDYRGVCIWTTSTAPSRVLGHKEALALGLVQS